MSPRDRTHFEITCPCCATRLKVDAEMGKVIGHEAAPKRERAADLERAAAVLQKRAEQREAHFRESAEEEKIKSQLLDRKFEEALAKAKDQPGPTAPPTLDIDLD